MIHPPIIHWKRSQHHRERSHLQLTRFISTRLMPPLSILKVLPGWLLTTALLSSCGLRLPVESRTIKQPMARLKSSPTAPAKTPDVLVWLIAEKYHSGMVFPYDWLEESGFVPPPGFGKPRFVAMSWGNRDAYSPQGVNTPRKLIRVFLTPTPSVMEMIPVQWNVAEVIPQQRILRKLVPRTRGPALATFLNECCVSGPDGRPKVVCESSWGHGVQLECRQAFFIPRVCNVWTVQTIECLGGQINPWLALTADGLIRQVQQAPNDFELIWPGGGKPSLSLNP